VALVGLATALVGCKSTPSAHTSSTTTTLPPLPPSMIAYVALAGTGGNLGFGSSVVPVNVTTGAASVGAAIHVGTYPDAVAVSPNHRLAVVANFTSDDVTPIDLTTGRALASIPAGPGPAGVAITPDGSKAYVTDDGSLNTLGDTVTPIDLKTMKPLARIKVGPGPQGIAITPDGSKAFVADAGSVIAGQPGRIGHQVTPIDLTTGKTLAPIDVGNGPIGVAITPDGSTVFVTNLNSESVSPINVAGDQALAPITMQGGPVAVTIAGGVAWVVNTPVSGFPGNDVEPITVANDKPGKPVKVSQGAQGIAASPNGQTVWVACLNANQLVPIGVHSRHALKPVTVYGGPFAVALAEVPQGSAAPAASSPTSPTTASAKPKKHKKTTSGTT
jgi:hyaluronoglucosaminidase